MNTGTSKGNTVPEGYSDSLRWLDTVFQGQYLPSFTNVQCWPQDPYFPFSSLVPHFSEVWKCGKV